MASHKMEVLTDISIHRLVPLYLMSSYLYYECDKNVLDDVEFDYLCKRLLDNWNDVRHIHKHLIDKDNLKAGSGYGITYTNRIIGGAMSWYKQETNGE